jgi:DNA-binding response OmpR family regulator
MIRRSTILLAEDDVSIADLLVDILTEEGYVVQLAATGSDALAALQADRLDLALVDLHMPGLNGWEVLEAVRMRQIAVPIVIMTASTLDAEALVAAGARTCLYKPFDLDELLACVAEHIRQELA